MNKDYQLLHELIDQVGDFQKYSPHGEMKDFAVWLGKKVIAKEDFEIASDSLTNVVNNDDDKAVPFQRQENYSILALVTYLYRYARLYAKKALEEHQSAFVTYDELVYLITLYFDPRQMSKTQVIEANIHEKPTGMEIIKRLLKNNLIEQSDSKEDKRVKYLKVTPRGEAELMRILGTMRSITQLVSGNLTQQENQQLFQLLRKLHEFHNPIFLDEKEQPLEEILKKLV
ncbi:MAG: MarR family winged helix-turn-helix transcriptional regulator [Thermoflexibacter sp.]|nr:MarR family winged helix-turn-helix transcriptional regulator [Thermoflexibacter sp.]